MNAWSAYAEYDATETPPELHSELFEALIEHAPGVGPGPNGNLSLRLMIQADSALKAASETVALADIALHKIGLSPTLVGIEVVTEAELDRRQAEPSIPELASIAEAADILGVHKQQVDRLVGRGDLPAAQTLEAGPIFAADTVRGFAQKRQSRRIGRPVADLGLSPIERDLLNLLATASDELKRLSSSELPNPDQIIAEVYSSSRFRVHLGADAGPLNDALSALSRHKLVRTRKLTLAERATGDRNDAVVTILAKGRRHASSAHGGGEGD
ncbi:helix-turn-helix domain-containing protein [Streptomyces sp. BE147]|uniref:helix-turn-helix domain-containing protein n=1 Tax=Streptomyces sp. BE147 TaxID=3002524 RepID=UPI002E777EAA|nr:helix-turn-helix domain-containing protein [Streptomyces sp. BE147]MEE1737024.1 helix-turn-helix domain-containing protein [Streptomyces sp. BE147]